jgi:hypothetical protein
VSVPATAKLLADIWAAIDHLDGEARDLTAARLRAVGASPPVMGVLDLVCDDELVRVLDLALAADGRQVRAALEDVAFGLREDFASAKRRRDVLVTLTGVAELRHAARLAADGADALRVAQCDQGEADLLDVAVFVPALALAERLDADVMTVIVLCVALAGDGALLAAMR